MPADPQSRDKKGGLHVGEIIIFLKKGEGE